jgi:hypothetical protein
MEFIWTVYSIKQWIFISRYKFIHRLRLFENRVLRRVIGSKREEVVGGWKRLHNEELHNMYASQNIIRVIK